jgi:hypothetical protein
MIDRLRSLPPAQPVPLDPPSRVQQPSARGRPAATSSSPASPPAAKARAPAEAASVRRLLVDIDRQREQLDRAIRQAAAGKSFSPAELCALQLRLYTYGESLEVLSHLVDRAVSAVKTTLNTQV